MTTSEAYQHFFADKIFGIIFTKIISIMPYIQPAIFGETIAVPLVSGRVNAGFPSPALDYFEERIDLPKELVPNPLSTFLIRVQGDSMLDAHIPEQSILVIDRSLEAKHGDVVVAVLDGDFTVKYFRKRKGQCSLIPANKEKKYPVIDITEEMDSRIWGVVINIVINTKLIRQCMP